MSELVASGAIESDVELPKDGWVIEPRRSGPTARARELWRYRRLLKYFALRSLQKGTRRTILGRWWLLIRPLFPIVVATVIFGNVLMVSSDGVPYFLFALIGSSVWELFASAAMWATRSLDINRGLLTRIYIPRLLMPIAAVTPSLLTFTIYMGVGVVAATYYRVHDGRWYVSLGAPTLLSVLALVLTLILAIGIGFWTAFPALVARDVRFTLGYILGFWVFLTPVVYPLSNIPEKWRWLVLLNPMAAYTEMFKWGILRVGGVHTREVWIAVGVTFLVTASGLWFFDRTEAGAADKA